MGFSIESSVPALTVFIQGLLSFFSPCVLPLVPLYIGYLAGGAQSVDETGAIHYRRSKVMVNTLCFVVGVSFAFFLLGFGFTALGRFFSGNRTLFARIGGVLVILFGLFQLGVFGSAWLQRERRLPFRLGKVAMNPVVALVLGFTFSFAWTPCVGPALASVLLMASSANSAVQGFLLIGVYTLGFVLPFLAVGLFTGALLDFFKRHQRVVRVTVKVGGVLMILMGVMMLTGWMNGVTGYLSRFGGGAPTTTDSAAPQESAPVSAPNSAAPQESSPAAAAVSPSPSAAATPTPLPKVSAPDFTLVDQYGTPHTLSDYKGKTVFLNFWATWCGPCRQEMPDIQQLYEDYGGNTGELIVLGVANPSADGRPGQEGSAEQVAQFLSEGGYTYPTVMDTTGQVLADYGISAFPTTFMIDKDGNVFGYASGSLTRSIMEDIIRQTMTGERS